MVATPPPALCVSGAEVGPVLRGAVPQSPIASDDSCEVLLLDDVEMDNVLMAQAISGIRGCRTVAFTDPAAALTAIMAQPDRFSSLVADYDMPGMNGIAFVRSVRAIAGVQYVPSLWRQVSISGASGARRSRPASPTSWANRSSRRKPPSSGRPCLGTDRDCAGHRHSTITKIGERQFY